MQKSLRICSRIVLWGTAALVAAFLVMPTGTRLTGYADLSIGVRVVDGRGQLVPGSFAMAIRDVEPTSLTEVRGDDGTARVVQWFPRQRETTRWLWGGGPCFRTDTCKLNGTLRISAPGYERWEAPLSRIFGPAHDIEKSGTNLWCTVSLAREKD
jgi:hypothetical protein